MNLDRIQKLIALAGNNASVEEARTAAYLAVKAIRDGRYVLLAPDDPRLLPPPRPRADPWDWGSTWDPPASPPPRPQPRPAPRPAPPPPPPAANSDSDLPYKLITLQFPGWCTRCKARIPEGARAYWRKGDGCVCVACREPQRRAA